MLLPNPLDYHRWFAKCAWVGALPQVARRFGVFGAAQFEVGRSRMPMTSIFSRWHSIHKLVSVLFFDCMGVLLVHRCFECVPVFFGGFLFRIRVRCAHRLVLSQL
jgi:hypothetical protein